jgi:hypothetical protein
MASMTNRKNWNDCRQHQGIFALFVSVTPPSQINPLNGRSWALPVMSVDSSNWIGKQFSSLMSACDSPSSDKTCTCRLIMLWHRNFQNVLFIFLAKCNIYDFTALWWNWWLSNYMWFNLLPRFLQCHSFLLVLCHN